MKYFLLGTEVLILTIFASLAIRKYYHHQQVLGAQIELAHQTEDSQKKIKYWEGIAQKNPDYRDSYVQLAVLNYTLGNLKQATFWVQQLRQVDPNFAPVEQLPPLELQ